ncbi:MAG TPA: ferritin-like domain-containing protein [Mycobacteriales bacterium]|nr:ferritin-like domain-containing protein [Mycobacteriales bacterium]
MSTEKMFGGEPVLKFGRETDRRSFLRYAGLVGVGAAFVAGGAMTSSSVAVAAPASGSTSDVDILNYALTLEYLESDFYTQGLAANLLTGRDLELVSPIKDHEDAHVQAVTAAVRKLGGSPVPKPKITYPADTFKSKAKFLATAAQFEALGVVAYHGQVTLIKSGEILGAAASIAGVESRHAAILAELTGGEPFPAPVEDHKPMSYVLPKVKPFLG